MGMDNEFTAGQHHELPSCFLKGLFISNFRLALETLAYASSDQAQHEMLPENPINPRQLDPAPPLDATMTDCFALQGHTFRC